MPKTKDSSLLLLNIEQALSLLSETLRLPVGRHDVLALIQLNVLIDLKAENDSDAALLPDELGQYGATVRLTRSAGETETLLTYANLVEPSAVSADELVDGWLVLQVHSYLTIKMPRARFRPYEYQLFMKQMRADLHTPAIAEEAHAEHSESAEDVSFSSKSAELAALAASRWRNISKQANEASDLERRVTPSIYGVKTRLLPLVTSVVSDLRSANSVVCDLMSGSGILSRRFASVSNVFSNDANSYGKVLAHSLTANLAAHDVERLATRLRSRMVSNMDAIEKLYGEHLLEENHLLHEARTPAAMERYEAFTRRVPSFFGNLVDGDSDVDTSNLAPIRSAIAVRRGRPDTFPFVLATAYWANVHFGLRQAAILDSIRYAIEGESDALKVILLGVLIQAAMLCASGPHFAQPFRPRGPRQFKSLMDKRLKRLDAEFFSILSQRRLLPAPTYQIESATKLNWREALQCFTRALNGRSGVVYADPPYTSVQYSRYYHVLNVLIDYDYPVCSGPGICPDLEYRFSSRFEFKAGPAKKELIELIRQCAGARVDIALSYSKSGSVTVRDIIAELKTSYRNVEIYQSNIQHHTQGRASSPTRLRTVEYVLTGRTSLNL